VKKVEKDKGPFLDQTAFEKVNMEKLAQKILQWAEDDDPCTYEELETSIGEQATTKDTVAIREYIKRQLPIHGLRVTPEKTIVPYESTDNNQRTDTPATPEDSFSGPSVSGG
jgi:hypothetical protein